MRHLPARRRSRKRRHSDSLPSAAAVAVGVVTVGVAGGAAADKKTSAGYTLSHAIQTGVMTPHLGVGITVGDEEGWTTFSEILCASPRSAPAT